MAEIPLPSTTEGSSKLPKSRTVIKNCFNTGTHILSRPGIDSLASESGKARGSFVWNGRLYVVVGTTLYRQQADGTTTSAGTIAGSGNIDTAIGFNEAVIISRESAGLGYTLNTSFSLDQITDVDFAASNSVCHINGRFVYIPLNGDPAFFSDVGAGGTIGGTSFFDAEELPDKNKVCFNWKNFLVIGGTDSFEFFRDQGLTPVPYVRMSMRIDYGYIGALTQYADTFAFIGREIYQDAGIYLLGSGTAQKISNEYIDTILGTYTEDQLADAIGARYKWFGHDILSFTLPNHSFSYFNGWFVTDTREDGDNVPWKAGFITQFENVYYTAKDSDIGKLSTANTDLGNTFERSIDFGFYAPDNNDFTAQWLELGISQGYNEQSVMANNLLLDVSDFSAWDNVNNPNVTTNTDTAPDGTVTADTVEDDGIGLEYIYQESSIDSANTYVFSVYIKKDSTGRATRFPAIIMQFKGSTTEFNSVLFDTSTGETNIDLSPSTNVTSGVIDHDANYWRLWLSAQSADSANDTVRCGIYPSRGASATWVISGAATGSVVIWSAELSDTGSYSVNGNYLSEIGTIGLELSRDNVIYSPPIFRDVGIAGAYQDKLIWNEPGGLGYYTGFMGVRITTTDDIQFDVDKLSVGI